MKASPHHLPLPLSMPIPYSTASAMMKICSKLERLPTKVAKVARKIFRAGLSVLKEVRRQGGENKKPHKQSKRAPCFPVQKATVVNRWTLGPLLGKGAFAKVYLAEDNATGESAAVKIGRDKYGIIWRESEIYGKLMDDEGETMTGIPMVLKRGFDERKTYIVMSLLGKSLYDLCSECGGTLPLKTVLLVAIQMLERLEAVHRKGFVHHDVKPENIMVGRGEERNTLFLADFGLAEEIYDSHTGRHLPMAYLGDGIAGTAQYASLHCHEGKSLSRRDDLISLGYMLVLLLRGWLPWYRDSVAKTEWKKRRMIHADLCVGLPRQMEEYFDCVTWLRFEEQPDYDGYKRGFAEALGEIGGSVDDDFEWVHREEDSEAVQDETSVFSGTG